MIDTHCHLHDREFFSEDQAEEMLKRAEEKNVKKIICIGTSIEDSLSALDFSKKHENVFWTYGVHPEGANNGLSQFSLPETREELVAIGEVGLDYHYDGYNREKQIKLFEKMLQLARDNNLPVSFHVREAFNDFFGVISNFPEIRGVLHSFTDNKKVLKRILNETEFFVGVNGLSTYSTLPLPPLERILLETDAPFLTPKPFRGIINEPAYVSAVALTLSEKLGQEFKIIERETTKNAEQLFRFKSTIVSKGGSL